MHAETIYERGELSVEQLRDEIKSFWLDLKAGSEGLGSVDAGSFDVRALDRLDPGDPITVRAGSSGADPASVVLIIAFAPTLNRALKDIWKTAILPRIRRRWGDDAIGREVAKDDE